MEHTSAFTVFPDDGIHIEPHYIRRVTSYDGAVLEEDAAERHRRDSARRGAHHGRRCWKTWCNSAPACAPRSSAGRPAGKTGTTNDFTDAWYIGFTPQITAGVWVGNDDKRVSLGKKETGARAALPIWLEYMQQAMQGMPVENFPNVVPLEKQAGRACGTGRHARHGSASRCRRAGADADQSAGAFATAARRDTENFPNAAGACARTGVCTRTGAW